MGRAVAETGITTIGITTADGVGIATDKRATLGWRVVSLKRFSRSSSSTRVQRSRSSVASAVPNRSSGRPVRRSTATRRGATETGACRLATLVENFARGGPFLAINPIIDGIGDHGQHVNAIDPGGGVMKDDYTVTGSGLTVPSGTLEDRYEPEMSNDEGTDGAGTAINAAAERDTGSGNGLSVAEITEADVEIRDYPDCEDVF